MAPVKLLESTTSKVVTGVVALAVVVMGITWWQTPPETREAILTAVGRIAAWLGIVVIAPWAGILAIGWVAKRAETNTAGLLLVGGLTLAEAVLLAWLLEWGIRGGSGWTLFLLGVLVAGAYNLLVCDWLAERVT